MAYSATPEGVKEDVVLSGPSSPTSFDFTVVPSPGLTAEESGGGIDFVDATGTTQAAFAPPFAYDAAFEDTGAEGAFTEDAVTLRIVESSPQLVVRLAADPAWLAAPERVWPVVIDLVLTIGGSDADTYLSKSSRDTNLNTSSRFYVSGGSAVRRILHAKDIASFFDEPTTLFSATFQLYATDDTSAQPAAPVGLHEMATREWSSGDATWNTRLAPGLRWPNPGGDFVAQPSFVNPKVTGTPGWRSWPMTELAQKWLDGTPYSTRAVVATTPSPTSTSGRRRLGNAPVAGGSSFQSSRPRVLPLARAGVPTVWECAITDLRFRHLRPLGFR